jgi:hypothetical protein
MNERIEKLAEQCGFRSNPNIYDRNQSFDIEKFAELIVRECCSIADDWVNNYNDGENYPSERIKEHFGVKE